MKIRTILLSALAILLLAGLSISAPPPQLVNLQGRLTDAGGNAINVATDMRFQLFDAATGGNLLITDTHAGGSAVAVQSGLYNVLIGSGTITAGTSADLTTAFAATATVFAQIEVWNGTAYETLLPRVQLAAAPYALNADRLDGLDSADFLLGTAASNIVTGSSLTVDSGAALNIAPGGTLSIDGVVAAPTALDVNSGQLYLDGASGHLGIGTNVPEWDLHVVGPTNFAGAGTITAALGANTATGTGSAFTTELRTGDVILVGTDWLVVDTVSSDTSVTFFNSVEDSTYTNAGYTVVPSAMMIESGGGIPLLFANERLAGFGLPGAEIEVVVFDDFGVHADVDDNRGIEVDNEFTGVNAESSISARNDLGNEILIGIGSSIHSNTNIQDRGYLETYSSGMTIRSQTDIFFDTGGAPRALLDSNGNLGIGNFNPGGNLPVSRLHVEALPAATADHGMLTIGDGPFDGISGGTFSGSPLGTTLAMNMASSYGGGLIDLQVNGFPVLKVGATGGMFTPSQKVNGIVIPFGNPVRVFAPFNGTASHTVPANKLFVLTSTSYGSTPGPVVVDPDGVGPGSGFTISGGAQNDLQIIVPSGGIITADGTFATDPHFMGYEIDETRGFTANAADYKVIVGAGATLDIPAGFLFVVLYAQSGAVTGDQVTFTQDGQSFWYVRDFGPTLKDEIILLKDDGVANEIQITQDAAVYGFLIPDTP
jgi:hypothetical protein